MKMRLLLLCLSLAGIGACSRVVVAVLPDGSEPREGGAFDARGDIPVSRDVASMPDDATHEDAPAFPDEPPLPPLPVCDWGGCSYDQTCCGVAGASGVVPTCQSTCPADSPHWCNGPQDCGGNPCCEDVSGPSLDQLADQGTYCGTDAGACVPTLQDASSSIVTRVCRTDADCAPSTDLPTCCRFASGFGLCLNGSLARYVNAICW